jgi:hypothetical protein
MEKRLIVVGNSLALVIDKSIRKLLGITYKTRFNVTTDGARLIVEPVAKEPVRAASSGRGLPLHIRRFNAIRVYDSLVELGLDNEKFIRLTGARIWSYRARLESRLADESLILAMDRLDVCIDVFNAGGSWEQAMTAALSAVPAAGDSKAAIRAVVGAVTVEQQNVAVSVGQVAVDAAAVDAAVVGEVEVAVDEVVVGEVAAGEVAVDAAVVGVVADVGTVGSTVMNEGPGALPRPVPIAASSRSRSRPW